MDSTVKSEGQEPEKKLSNTFYAELLSTGVFSDITFKYGKHHTFKLHSMVLKSKSTWFAKRIKDTKANVTNNYEIFDEGFSGAALQPLTHWKIKPCNENAISEFCLMKVFLNSMIRFCYLGQYPPLEAIWQNGGPQVLCISHICLYYLAIRYGINSLLQPCATAFSETMDTLRSEKKVMAEFINAIYDLPGLKHDDLLRAAAKTQLKFLAGDDFIQSRNHFINEINNSSITRAMPRASRDLLFSLLLPTATTMDLDSLNTSEPDLDALDPPQQPPLCARCINPLPSTPSTPASKLCKKCSP